MRFHPLVVAGAVVVLDALPLAAQLRSTRPVAPQASLPWLLVANPHSSLPRDSAPAVRIGQGMRDRIAGVAERWYRTVERARMNDALINSSFPVDAVLAPEMARQLARELQARTMVLSTILHGEGDRVTLETRLIGWGDEAGQVVQLTQRPNESFEELGDRAGRALEPAFKALPDARQCEGMRATAPEKAGQAAGRALRNQPNSGLANYCLAQIVKGRKAGRDTVIALLTRSTQGDPLSLAAWTALSVEYQATADTAATIETFRRMLRVAPTNEALRTTVLEYLLRAGRAEVAEDVADEGLRLDPADVKLLDLLSTACLMQDKPQKNRRAVEALERIFVLDSAKVDSTFFLKITFVASRPVRFDTLRLAPDSSGRRRAGDSVVAVVDAERFLRWSRIGVGRYPANSDLFGQLVHAYSLAGPMDSAVAAVRRLMAMDSSSVGPVLRVAKALSEGRRGREALELEPYVERLGGMEDRRTMAAILTTGGFGLIQPPPDYVLAADMSRAAVKLVPADIPAARTANFVRGLAVFQQVVALDQQAVKAKSCPLAQEMRSLLDEAGPALEAGRPINPPLVERYLSGVGGFRPHVTSLIRAYCK